jgi:hypothetical protein
MLHLWNRCELWDERNSEGLHGLEGKRSSSEGHKRKKKLMKNKQEGKTAYKGKPLTLIVAAAEVIARWSTSGGISLHSSGRH